MSWAVLLGAATAGAQTPDSAGAGAIAGTVVAAETGEVLPGADVTLAPAPFGMFGGRGAFWRASVSTTTDAAGRYRFTRIPPGRYTLRVRRLGFRPSSLEIEFDARHAFEISVGLVVAPIALEAMQVTAPGLVHYRARDDDAEGRSAMERLRQRRFLPSDVRVLTAQDVSEAVTLGESDLFRALQRVPGVATRDDYTAELWTRGAPWNQTRIYFDGMPLFNPVHAVGTFAGVDPDAVGSAIFEPGVRSPALGGGAAGALELTSRTAEGAHLGGAAALSVVSARATADQRIAGGRGGWMVAARRSYVDLLTAALQGLGDDSAHIPYAFTDLVTRLEIPLGAAAGIETSVLLERDDVRGDVPNLLSSNQGHWGNAAGRATLVLPIGGVETRTTVGASRFDASIRTIFRGAAPSSGTDTMLVLDVMADSSPTSSADSTPADTASGAVADLVPVHAPTANRVTYLTAGTRLAWGDVDGAPAWRIGVGVEHFAQSYRGPQASPYPQVPAYDSLTFAAATTMAIAWAERRIAFAGITFDLGARLEAGPPAGGVGALRLAPRLAARYRFPDGQTMLSAAYGRSFQYVQSVAPAGAAIGPELHLTDVWLVAGDTTPAIRADVVTAGIEHWLGSDWLLRVTGYVRRATGLALPDPTAGLLAYNRPLYALGVNRARGVEAGLRRFAGAWAFGVSYTRAVSENEARGLVYPAATDRREILNATVSLRAGSAWRLGAALTLASGAPYTRNGDTATVCEPTFCSSIAIGPPNAERAPAYSTASVMAEWVSRHSGWELHAFFQLHNVLPGRNAVTYAGTVSCTTARAPYRIDPATGTCDEFDRGLPVLPLAGVRVAF
ncbi:MAG TPA: carboxypeptidase regulatory-like domain-containing protein [Gemmatimonadales bacterium]|nr:carboxypeptidase regulatory-like domain-containing protein [Gemmatimonadales bacterium]